MPGAIWRGLRAIPETLREQQFKEAPSKDSRASVAPPGVATSPNEMVVKRSEAAFSEGARRTWQGGAACPPRGRAGDRGGAQLVT